MTDIVERLRHGCSCNFPDTPCGAEEECRAALDAADEITRLRAENERLREWNREIALNAREFVAENERLRADLRLAIMSDSDECKALSQEVERLVKSRNRWGQKYNALLEKHKRLRAALRPFAEAADGFDMTRIKNPEEWFAYRGIVSSTESKGAITVGDLRRARAALDGQPAPRWKGSDE